MIWAAKNMMPALMGALLLAGVMGAAGHNSAREMLADFKRRRID
jgi:hypothetical protein